MSFPTTDGPTQVAVTVIPFAVGTTVTRAGIPVLCADLAELVRGRGPAVVICDVAGITRPDLVTVEALARLQVTARRHGCRLVVRAPGAGLVKLVGLLGLAGALPESGRQPEEREQARGVEEAVDRRDPPG